MKLKMLAFSLFFFLFHISSGLADEWEEYKSRHFLIKHRKDVPYNFVQNVERSAERYYEDITRDLGFKRFENWTYDDRAELYIYSNADDYVASSQGYGWSHGVASPKDKIIRTFPAAHGFFDSTLPHELTHIIFREFVGFKAEVPLWFEEGVAMYQEQAKRYGANEAVRKAIDDGSFIPLPELTHMRLGHGTEKERVSLFYAEAASIVYYLITEQGKSRFVRFCRELEEGRPFEWTLKSVYVRFQNLEKLNEAWERYLQK